MIRRIEKVDEAAMSQKRFFILFAWTFLRFSLQNLRVQRKKATIWSPKSLMDSKMAESTLPLRVYAKWVSKPHFS
jgi:hypothetical protein